MKIVLNDKVEQFDNKQFSLSKLLALKAFTSKNLVVKVNSEMVKRHEFDKITLKDGDVVMVLNLVSGG